MKPFTDLGLFHEFLKLGLLEEHDITDTFTAIKFSPFTAYWTKLADPEPIFVGEDGEEIWYVGTESIQSVVDWMTGEILDID